MDEGWLVPPGRPRLALGEVHVWRAGLRQGEAMLSESRALLSEDERERAGRFHFRKDRDRCVAARFDGVGGTSRPRTPSRGLM